MGIIHITNGENERLVVQFRYSPERVAAVKRIPGRKWHPIKKVWTVPFSPKVIEQIQNLFLGDRVVLAESVRAASPELASDQVKMVVSTLDEELTLREYSSNTRDNYRLHMLRFLRWLRKDPSSAEEGDLRAYLVEMLDNGLSASYVRQAKAALIVYYESVLKQPEKISDLPGAKSEKKLPLVLSKDEIRRLLQSSDTLKNETFLTLVYSAGLRTSEAIQLRIENILSNRHQIRVICGKGDKDRYTILADKALLLLRDHYREYRPVDWLFPGKEPKSHISASTAQRILQRVREKAQINPKATLHTLRHSFGRPFGRLINASLDAARCQERVFSPWRLRGPSPSELVSFQGK